MSIWPGHLATRYFSGRALFNLRAAEADEFGTVGNLINQQQLTDAFFHHARRNPYMAGDFRVVETIAN